MFIIVLSILSALTSGPIVIQRHVKAFHRLSLSTPSDSSVEFPPFTMLFMAGLDFMPVFLFIMHGNFADPKLDGTLQPASIVMTDTAMMCFFMVMFILGMGAFWLHGFYGHVKGYIGLNDSLEQRFFREDRSHLLHPGTSLVTPDYSPFIDSCSEPESGAPLRLIVPLAFCLVVYSTKMLPAVKRFAPDYFEEYTRDFQLPMGPTLSQRTLEEVHLVVVIYIPSAIILFFCYLGPLIFYLRVPILASTSMLPSVIRYRTGRFVGAAARCASWCLLPCGSTNSNLKVSRRHPIDWIIYHCIAFGQLLLFVGWHIWIFLFVYFVDGIIRRTNDTEAIVYVLTKFILYPGTVIVLIYVWIIAATGALGEIRWWPSRDHLSRLVPPSIKNVTRTKSMWTL